MILLIKSTPENRKLVFNAIKAKILKHLEELEKKEGADLKKTFSELTGLMLKGGKGLPVGTIREWKGKKFIKVAPGKWKPKYDSETRGARMSIAAIKRKADSCEDAHSLMSLIFENKDRFSDENGTPLACVKELSDFIEQTRTEKEPVWQKREEKERKKAEKEAIKQERQRKKNLAGSGGGGDDGEELPDDFKGKTSEAISFLLKRKEGEAKNALYHKDIGYIDIMYGKEGTAKSDGYGLAKIAKFHPEVLDNLQEIISSMMIVGKTKNRIQLESKKHKASIRLDWNGESKKWLLTAFEKESDVSDSRTDIAGTDNSRKNDTATPTNIATTIIPQSGEKSSLFELDSNKKNEIAVNVPEYAYKDVLESVNHRSFEDAISFLEERITEFSESIEKYSFYKNDSKYIDKLNAYKKVLAEFTTDKSIWAKTHIERMKKDIALNNERIEDCKKDIESYKKKLIEVEKAPSDSRFKFPKEKTLHTKQYTIKYYKGEIDRCNSDIKESEERNAKFKKDIQTAEVLIDKKINTKKQTNGKRTKKQVLIDHIKQMVNVDLSQYVDDEHSKHKYLNVVWNKIPYYEQHAIERLAHQYKGYFKLEPNGFSRMALFYGDKLQDSSATDENSHLSKSIVWLQNYLSKSEQKEESAIEALRKRLEKEGR